MKFVNAEIFRVRKKLELFRSVNRILASEPLESLGVYAPVCSGIAADLVEYFGLLAERRTQIASEQLAGMMHGHRSSDVINEDALADDAVALADALIRILDKVQS